MQGKDKIIFSKKCEIQKYFIGKKTRNDIFSKY